MTGAAMRRTSLATVASIARSELGCPVADQDPPYEIEFYEDDDGNEPRSNGCSP